MLFIWLDYFQEPIYIYPYMDWRIFGSLHTSTQLISHPHYIKLYTLYGADIWKMIHPP